jgi:regulator of replication initiation timing
MATRRTFFERDGRGRERVVVRRVSRGRSVSRGCQSASELREALYETEERKRILEIENNDLRDQLSYAEHAQYEFQKLKTEHHSCRNLQAQLDAQYRAARTLKDTLYDEREDNKKLQHKNEKLEEKLRLMKRGSGESYRTRYEEAVLDAEAYRAEVESLRRTMVLKDDLVRARDADLRLAATRIANRDNTIGELKACLKNLGLRFTY